MASEYLMVVKKETDHASREERQSYEQNFNKKVRHCPVFKIRDRTYIVETFNWTKEKPTRLRRIHQKT